MWTPWSAALSLSCVPVALAWLTIRISAVAALLYPLRVRYEHLSCSLTEFHFLCGSSSLFGFDVHELLLLLLLLEYRQLSQ